MIKKTSYIHVHSSKYTATVHRIHFISNTDIIHICYRILLFYCVRLILLFIVLLLLYQQVIRKIKYFEFCELKLSQCRFITMGNVALAVGPLSRGPIFKYKPLQLIWISGIRRWMGAPSSIELFWHNVISAPQQWPPGPHVHGTNSAIFQKSCAPIPWRTMHEKQGIYIQYLCHEMVSQYTIIQTLQPSSVPCNYVYRCVCLVIFSERTWHRTWAFWFLCEYEYLWM